MQECFLLSFGQLRIQRCTSLFAIDIFFLVHFLAVGEQVKGIEIGEADLREGLPFPSAFKSSPLPHKPSATSPVQRQRV